MLDHRLRRWSNMNTTLDQRLVFTGLHYVQVSSFSGFRYPATCSVSTFDDL